MPVDLVFKPPALAGYPLGLVFGEDTAPEEVINTVEIAAQLPGLQSAAARVAIVRTAAIAVQLPGLAAAGQARYVSNTARPTVGQSRHPMQGGLDTLAGAQLRHQAGAPMPASRGPSRWEPGQRLGAPLRVAQPDLFLPAPVQRAVVFEGAVARFTLGAPSHQDAQRLRAATATGFEEASDVRQAASALHQDTLRRRSNARTRYQVAAPLLAARHQAGRLRAALPLDLARLTRYREAWPPRAGVYVPPPPGQGPGPESVSTDLVFHEPFAAHPAEYLFRRGGWAPPTQPVETVIVPVQRVYIVLNNVTARRIDGNVPLTILSASMELSRESWTWQFQASLPRTQFPLLEPASEGDPVEIEVTINGAPYRMIVEDIDRSRAFNKGTLSITCRGRAAMLDTPIAPVLQFANAGALTAAQLMADVLTFNGQPLGWSVNFNLTDWLVPANTLSLQGSYIQAINAIAQAAGGYVQPHATAQQLQILPAYPALPWEWADVTPDYELPAAVTVLEGMRVLAKPAYNRVFVVGAGGIGQVSRAGTAGNLEAPMVTDPLASHVDARRQRGRAILGDTGRQLHIRLKVPVLEATGIIQPGKFVRYVDGADTYMGIARAVSVEISRAQSLNVWQTLTVETHL